MVVANVTTGEAEKLQDQDKGEKKDEKEEEKEINNSELSTDKTGKMKASRTTSAITPDSELADVPLEDQAKSAAPSRAQANERIEQQEEAKKGGCCIII